MGVALNVLTMVADEARISFAVGAVSSAVGAVSSFLRSARR